MKVFLIIFTIFLCFVNNNAQCLTRYQYLSSDGSSCLPCPYNCLSCIQQSNCLECVKEYFLTVDQKCEKCTFGCSVCINNQTCSTCNDGLYLTSDGGCAACQNGVATCTIAIIQTCQSNYFLLSTICAGCFSNCKICLDFITCSQCNQNYYLSLNALSCLPCPSNCLICSDSQNCLSCQSGYDQSNGLCESSNCSHIGFCKSCSGSLCLRCEQGKYLNASGKCQQGGSILCLSSTGPYQTHCQTGDYGCPSYSLLQLDENNNQLSICLPKKATKSKQYIYLTDIIFNCNSSCSDASSLNIDYKTTQAYYNIIYRLKLKFYSNSNTVIRNLNIQLKSSNGTIISNYTQTINISSELNSFDQTDPTCNNCLVSHKAINGQLIVSGGQNSTTFVFSDNNGLFQVEQAMFQHSICQVRFCSICNSEVDCTSCFSPYYLQLTSCVQKCDSGFYQYQKACYLQCPKYTYTVQSIYSCLLCKYPCLTCLDQSQCSTCVQGTYLQGNSCVTNCSTVQLFPNSTTMICQTCPNPCVTCSIQNQTIKCLSCSQGYLLNDGSCVFTCPWGQFGTFLNSLSQCVSCSSNCTQCYIKNNFCTSCTSGFLLYQSDCNQTNSCPFGFFSNYTFNTCQTCQYPCSTCQFNRSYCKSCIKGSLMNNQCLNKCPDYYYSDYSDSMNITCKICNSSCKKCDSLLQCTSCINGFYLFQKSCLIQCPIGYYNNSNTFSCSNCKPPCKSCLNQQSCLSCTTGYLNNFGCTLQCNSSSYIDSNFSCKLCASPCQKCYSQTFCIYCSLPYLLFNGQCIIFTQCSAKIGYYPQYFPNETNKIYAQCKLCTFPCSSCTNNSVTCLTCSNNYLYVPNLYKCVSTCPTSYYQNTTTCQICDNNCFFCDIHSKNCTACSAGFYLQSVTRICVTNCPQQFYGDDSTKSCIACLPPCKACYNAYLCMSCISQIFYLKQCISQCPSSTFQNTTLKTCISCTDNCLTCTNLSNYCLSCVNGYFLFNSSCINNCPSLFYNNEITKICELCAIPCSQCSSAINCLTCINGFYFINNQCKSSCPSSYFANTLANTCQSCNNTICLTCVDSSNNCLTCNVNNGYYLSNQLCVSECLNSSYKNYITGVCENCTFPCNKCVNNTYCQICEPLYYLFENRCFSKCPISYFANSNSNCQKCGLNCQTCTTLSACLQCMDGFYILNDTCVALCPIGYYAGNQQMTNYQQCFNCSSTCLNCSSLEFCYQCIPERIGFNGLCLTECPLLHYKQNSTNQCSKCSNFCTSCINSTFCLKCIGSFLFNNQCVQNCPNKTYPYQGATCESCKSPCDECSGDFICKTCLQGYIYFSKYCVVQCPSDVWYYPSNNSCNPQCPYNKYLQKMQCYVGNCGLYLVSLNGYCLKQCSSNYYINHNQQCVLCSTNPSLCASLFIADLRIVYVQALTLVLYFNQKSQKANINNINVQFKDISGKTSFKNYTSYQISEYKIQIKYDYKEISLNNVTITIPFVKSQETSQSIFKNSIQSEIDKYDDYGAYTNLKFVQFIPMALISILIVIIVINLLNKINHYTQILDYAQIIAVTLYLDIQYPPILESFLAGFKLSLGLFAKNLVNIFPYNFSAPKFIYYHIDTSIIRSQLLLLIIFLSVLIFFIIVIILNTYKPSLFSGLIKVVRYRWINDLFSICITPLYLFSFQITSLKPFQIFLTALLAILGVGYVAWISYKIVQVKKIAQLQGLIGNFQKTSSKLGLMYIPFAYIRRFVLTFGLGVAPLFPISTLTLLMVLTFLIMICIYFYEPFDNLYTDYVAIFMECSLTFYIICLVVMALQTVSPSNNHNFGIFLISVVSLTFVICLSWLIYLTVSDIKAKGCCPKGAQNQIDLQNMENDYSQTKSQKNRNRQAKQRQQQQKNKNNPSKKVSVNNDEISANQLLNRFNNKANELFIDNREANEQFKHWNQEDSQNSQDSKKSETKSNLLPELMIKNELKQIKVQANEQMNDKI